MAILATAVWEFDPGASNNNGGGYDAGISGAGADYSQQTTAQLALTDLAMTTGGATLTSATGGFTSAMIGNCIQITAGTNFTAGFYFITAYTDTNTVTIDRDATTGSNGSAGTGNVGGSLAAFTDAILEIFTAGNKLWVRNNGTMTITATIDISNAGTATAPFVVEGYNSTRGDAPTLANRPTIAAGANRVKFGAFWILKHFIFTTTEGIGLSADFSNSYNYFYNIKSTNSSGSGNRDAFYIAKGHAFLCEGISTLGRAFFISAFPSSVSWCYAHDSASGFECDATSDTVSFTGCIADTCTTGFVLGRVSTVLNSIAYNNTTGMSIDPGGEGNVFITNSILSDNTTGISAVADQDNSTGFHNLYYNNTSDVSNFTKGAGAVSGNPNFTDAANGDFTCTTGGAGIDAGPDLTLVGLTGSYKWNIGVDQDDLSAGGGGGTVSYISV